MPRKIAIITGGSRGLGANAALKLAARGTDLIITYKQDSASASSVVAQVVALGAIAVALQLDAGYPLFCRSRQQHSVTVGC